MTLCAEENLPLPAWAAEHFLKRVELMGLIPGYSLHDALGLSTRYPLSEKLSAKKQQDRFNAQKLYMLLRGHPQRFTSLTAAIKDVLSKNPDLPYSVSTARRRFEEEIIKDTFYG
jgi:Lhr-like helicase